MSPKKRVYYIFGGGYSKYIIDPLFWGHFNFDGEHYLSIVQNGYLPLQYFFFPVFPILMRFFSVNVGLFVSNLFFFLALIGIYKLVILDYEEKVAKLVIILLLLFSTSFYFGVYYTESLFLMLIIWAFYFARKKNFLLASLIATLGSATRIIGVVMFPVLIIEYFLSRKEQKPRNWTLASILIAPLGLLIYMYYLFKKTGDALIFLHQITIFGEQRSSTLILLRSEEHTSELQSPDHLVSRLLLQKKKIPPSL